MYSIDKSFWGEWKFVSTTITSKYSEQYKKIWVPDWIFAEQNWASVLVPVYLCFWFQLKNSKVNYIYDNTYGHLFYLLFNRRYSNIKTWDTPAYVVVVKEIKNIAIFDLHSNNIYLVRKRFVAFFNNYFLNTRFHFTRDWNLEYIYILCSYNCVMSSVLNGWPILLSLCHI